MRCSSRPTLLQQSVCVVVTSLKSSRFLFFHHTAHARGHGLLIAFCKSYFVCEHASKSDWLWLDKILCGWMKWIGLGLDTTGLSVSCVVESVLHATGSSVLINFVASGHSFASMVVWQFANAVPLFEKWFSILHQYVPECEQKICMLLHCATSDVQQDRSKDFGCLAWHSMPED